MPSIYIFYCGVPVLFMHWVDLIDPTTIMVCQWTPNKSHLNLCTQNSPSNGCPSYVQICYLFIDGFPIIDYASGYL